MVIEVDTYSSIRTLYKEGFSERSIAKRLGIARQTVKKYCEGNTMPAVRKPYIRQCRVITDDVKRFIINCFIQDDEENLKKQKHTAKRIYDRLVNETGFKGSYSTVREAVRQLREEHYIPIQADIPLEFDAGDAAQIDWGEATVYFNSQKTKVNIFCGRLCYSCDIFVQAYPVQNQEAFLEAIQSMFDFFGGIPQRLIFDNAKVAVKEGFGLHAKATDKYASFAAHYSFTPEFCNIASGNEKGLVENLVMYSRRNFMVPVPRVADISELNGMLLKECLAYRENHKVESRTETVKQAYLHERPLLGIIPKYRYDTSKTSVAKANDYSLVRFDKNSYSVPIEYLRKDVTAKGYANEVLFFCSGKLIATHPRKYGKGDTLYRLEHYIDLLERKPRSVFQAKPVRRTVADELISWGKQLPGGNAEMVKLLRLCVDHGEDTILKAKASLPVGVIPTVDMIRSVLHEPTESNIVPFKNEISVNDTDLRKYDEKCGVVAK